MEDKPQAGIFAALLAELSADVEEARISLLRSEGQKLPAREDDKAGESRPVVQLPLPGVGALASLVEEEPQEADAEPAPDDRWRAREGRRHEKRPNARRRNERLYALKARRDAFRRPPSSAVLVDDGLDEEGLEESGATKCARPSLRVQLNQELIVVRRRAPAECLEEVLLEALEERPWNGGSDRWELELREHDGGTEESGVPRAAVEIDRVRVVKPAGVIAHLQAVDRALAMDA